MNQVSTMVRKFFENYERGSNSSELDLIASQYSDSFMFAGPQGGQAVKKDDFLKVLPKQAAFFKTFGLTSSKIQALEETRLDDHYVLVKVSWAMRFEKDRAQPIVVKISATYILYQQEDLIQIVFQLDHQDLMKRVEELGLLPAKE